MPFKFLDEPNAVVSSPPVVPPLNAAGSTAGEPKSTAPQSNFVFKHEDKGVPPTAQDLEELTTLGYKPSNEDLRTIYDTEQSTPTLSKLWKGTKEGVSGIVTPFAKAPKEFLSDPSAGRLLSSAGEGIVGAAQGTVQFATKPFTGAYDYLFDAPYRSDNENFEKWKLNYLATHDVGATPLPKSIMQSWTEYANREPVSDSAMIQPYPNVSSAIGTVASIPMFEAGMGATGLNRLITAPSLNISGRVLGATGRVLETAGKGFKWVGERPAAISEGITKKVLGENAAEQIGKAVKVGEIPAAGAAALLGEPTVAATIASAKALEKSAPIVSGAGAFARKLAQADPASPFGRLYTVAKDATAPEWMRVLADSWVTKVPAAIAETTATGAKSAAVGGLFGAALQTVSGDSPEEIGQGFGSGLALGGITATASAAKLRKMGILQRSVADVDRFYQSHIADGVAPESFKKVGTDAMVWGATMERIFGDGTKIRFAGENEGSPLPKNVHGQAGYWQPESKTLWVNTDSARSPSATVLHEILHPMYEGAVANRPEIKQQIDTVLQSSGQTLYSAKVQYALSLAKEQVAKAKTPVEKRAILDEAVKSLDAVSQARLGSPDSWIYSEILAEAGARSLFGKHPIFDVVNPAVTATALDVAKELLTKLGVQFKEKPTTGNKPATVLPGFENVIDSPELRKTVYALIRAQKEFLPGVTPATSQAVKINKDLWGKHPGAVLQDLPAPAAKVKKGAAAVPTEPPKSGEPAKPAEAAPAVKGNDFVVQKPDGTIAERPKREVKKLVRSRRKEVNEIYPLGGTPLPATDKTPGIAVRTTPSGLVERSGTELGPGFEGLQTFGAQTKAMARDLEAAIVKGEAREGWYQQIGESPEWKESVQRDTGALEAQFKEFIPINFLVDKQGNLLVRNYSLSALDRKAAEWASRQGPISLELWTGNVDAFKQDVGTYLKNHADGLPGESNNLGVDKKNVINAFLVGGNRTFEAKNPLRPSLKGSDRQGVVRSYRLDRLQTVEPGKSALPKPEYEKQVMNMSPNTEADPAKMAERFGMRFDTTYENKYWMFTAYDTQGKESTTFLVKTGSTPEQVAERYNEIRARFDGDANQPRPLLEGAFSPDVITDKEKPVIELTGADGKKYPAYFDGVQDFSKIGGGKIAQITPLEDIPGVITKGSTTYSKTLEKKGIQLPDLTKHISDWEKKQAEIAARKAEQASMSFSPDVYSQAERVIEEKFQGESMPKVQLAAMLRNPQHGVKPEEMKWSGLDELLKGTGRVSKKEVQDFLRLNNVKISERIKGEEGLGVEEAREKAEEIQQSINRDINKSPELSSFRDKAKAADELADSLNVSDIKSRVEAFDKLPDEWKKVWKNKALRDRWLQSEPWYWTWRGQGEDLNQAQAVFTTWAARESRHQIQEEWIKKLQEVFGTRHAEIAELESKALRGEQDSKTQYSKWQLPGGERYREILFTLSEKGLPPNYEIRKVEDGSTYSVFKDGKFLVGGWLTEEAAKKAFQRDSLDFKSSHFEEPNILAHARVNDRSSVSEFSAEQIRDIGDRLVKITKAKSENSLGSGAPEVGVHKGVITEKEAEAYSKSRGFTSGKFAKSGHDMLLVEEIQSDWHQKGRREGYANPPLSAQDKASVESEINLLNQDLSRYAKEIDAAKTAQQKEEARLQYDRTIAARDTLSQKILGNSGVPDAPFKTTWHEMAFRRLLLKAVKEGKDWLGWTTGEQQAERYDLSKHIDRIIWVRNEPEDGIPKDSVSGGSSTGTLRAFKDGGVVMSEVTTPDKLPDYVGKDVAERLLSAPVKSKNSQGHSVREISGLDLKVGGEGMRGFYDKILVDYANKFGKKFGAKVQDVPIMQDHDASKSELFTSKAKAIMVLNDGGEIYATFPRVAGEQLIRSYRELERTIEAVGAEPNGFYLGDKQPPTTVHALPITAAMKKSISEQGVALFSPDVAKETAAPSKPVSRKDRIGGIFSPVPPDSKEKSFVVAAAIKAPDGKIFTGVIHPAAIVAAKEQGVDLLEMMNNQKTADKVIEGFVTNDGKFLTRGQAFAMARKAGQLSKNSAETMKDLAGDENPELEAMNFNRVRKY